MKRSLWCSLVLGVFVAMGWFLAEAPASAQDGQGGVTVSGNGDVNGDNGLDLSDAIYLLSFLFQGGPAPLLCPPAAAGAGGGPSVGILLPDPGQAICTDADGSTDPEDCATGDCQGQDGAYAIGCMLTNPDRFILDNGGTDDGTFDMPGHPDHGKQTPFDDVVTDTCTGLMWQRATADTNYDRIQLDDDRIIWCEALTYCENLVLTVEDGFKSEQAAMDDGNTTRYDNWRMPNIRELLSITNVAARPAYYAYLPPGSSHPLFSPLGSSTWSSTSRLDNSEANHRTFFYGGTKGDITFGSANSKINPGWVRAVRTVPSAGGGARSAGGGRGQGGVTVSGNGDVNGDNGLDLSDAIYLLGFLFQGGPEPKPCPGTPATETNCDDTQDNDLDGATDCFDSDCFGVGLCPLAEICDNGEDDDDDTFIDCADHDCAQAASCQVEGGTGLPDTGQTVCVDASGNFVDCDDPSCFGLQDGSFDTGCGNLNRFIVDERGTPSDTSDDTVLDKCTGLTWQRDTADIPADEDDQVEWCDALAYCETLTFGGESDWRLPNVIELESLVHYGFVKPPAIDPIFDAERIPEYWTSTSHDNGDRNNWVRAWCVSFDEGTVDTLSKTEANCPPSRDPDGCTLLVRAVRGP